MYIRERHTDTLTRSIRIFLSLLLEEEIMERYIRERHIQNKKYKNIKKIKTKFVIKVNWHKLIINWFIYENVSIILVIIYQYLDSINILYYLVSSYMSI